MQAVAPSWSMGRCSVCVSQTDLTGHRHHPRPPSDGCVWRMSLGTVPLLVFPRKRIQMKINTNKKGKQKSGGCVCCRGALPGTPPPPAPSPQPSFLPHAEMLRAFRCVLQIQPQNGRNGNLIIKLLWAKGEEKPASPSLPSMNPRPFQPTSLSQNLPSVSTSNKPSTSSYPLLLTLQTLVVASAT